ncbi:Pyridoxine/pyridoxamine 5\\'-phosphate oxidase [Actinacidiphila cocklensis]|uniref:Pyridoxine/pyridoxamine 5\'-phosphate oxidase n=1 Tax=Actinacidiphila cocklensis TaxID=887465 RepID=A0A9W4DXS9_9ACTN|nr:Pyridoxine/pyridoxamine 5\\'-phosphate oxidase [Actinacidiphila cocklensis]
MQAEDDDTAAADRALMERVWAAPVLAGELPPFDPDTAPARPGLLFAGWLGRALGDGVPEPHIVTLSTAAADGTPSARVVMLRGVDSADCAVVFAGDRLSVKGRDLSARPVAALTWYWPAYGRQIRMAGPVDLLGAEATRQDFLARSPLSRAAAFTGRISTPLSGQEEYDRERRAAQALVAAEPERVPPTHAVYRLRAAEAEFFQARPDRSHARLRYTRDGDGDGWSRILLWP